MKPIKQLFLLFVLWAVPAAADTYINATVDIYGSKYAGTTLQANYKITDAFYASTGAPALYCYLRDYTKVPTLRFLPSDDKIKTHTIKDGVSTMTGTYPLVLSGTAYNCSFTCKAYQVGNDRIVEYVIKKPDGSTVVNRKDTLNVVAEWEIETAQASPAE